MRISSSGSASTVVWTGAGSPSSDSADVPAEAAALLAARQAARAAKDYARADALRDELAGIGWDVVDGRDRQPIDPTRA